ncbi:MAG TPA: YlxR family protein [Chloroflexota bacterium]|nr:YlxR family protein [Chloroflexota bacterium]
MTARPRHVPMRTCVGCRQEQPKRELVRVVRTPEGAVVVDTTGKANGRGAYLCRRPECWTAALRRNLLAGALRGPLTADDLAALREYGAALSPSAAPHGPRS